MCLNTYNREHDTLLNTLKHSGKCQKKALLSGDMFLNCGTAD